MSDVTSLDAAGERFIAGFEGGQSSDGLYRAYWDSAGQVWTIGIGETSGVRPGMVWTPERAYRDLRDRMARDYAPGINALGLDLTQNEFNAIADACWNLGDGCLGWDFGHYLRQCDFLAAGNALLQYDRAGGVVYSGLTRRREAERALLLTPEPLPVDPHHYLDYPDEVLHYGGRAFNERRLAVLIDGYLEHPHIHHHGLERDLPLAVEVRKRIWVVSVLSPPHFRGRRPEPDWGDHRGSRYQWWSARIEEVEHALGQHS